MSDRKFMTLAAVAAWGVAFAYLNHAKILEHSVDCPDPDVALLQRAERAEGTAEGMRFKISRTESEQQEQRRQGQHQVQ
jgi:hypothetical protein